MLRARLARVLDRGSAWLEPPRATVARPADGAILLDPDAPAIFVVGMGRSGTHFYTKLASSEPTLLARHMDDHDVLSDGFACWAAWHRIPVDLSESIDPRLVLAAEASSAGRSYFEANPLMGPWLTQVTDLLDARVIVSVRSPLDVVTSHLRKGWYSQPVAYRRHELVPGYQRWGSNRLHGFSRLVPSGDEYETWSGLSPAGRVAWLWSAYYTRILDDLEAMAASVSVVELESLDHEAYLRLAEWAGFTSSLGSSQFAAIREQRPGRSPQGRPETVLTERDVQVVHSQVEPTLYRCRSRMNLIQGS